MKPRSIQGTILIASLVVQYALGMYVNLFVPFPEAGTEGQLWEFAWSQPALATHIVLAILIFIGAVVLCIRAYLSRDSAWILPSFIGLLGVLIAGADGAQFIPTQSDLFSYLMALGFLIAALSYAWGLYRAKISQVK